MSAQSLRGDGKSQGSLSSQPDPPIGGLDHDQLNYTIQPAAVAEGLRAHSAVLLVGREAKVNVHCRLKALPEQFERRQNDAGHPALHVRRPTPIDPFAVAVGGEGRVRPRLLGVHVHRVQVSGHGDSPLAIPPGQGQDHGGPVGPVVEYRDLPGQRIKDFLQKKDGVLLVADRLRRPDSDQLPQNLSGTPLGLRQSRVPLKISISGSFKKDCPYFKRAEG